MFVLSNALKNTRRHGKRAALYFLICAVAVLTLQVYIASVDRTDLQLEQLAAAVELKGTVTNLDGSKDDGLSIREHTVESLLHSEHVRDLRITVMLRGAAPDATETQRRVPAVGLTGLNRIEALDGLPEAEISWLPGWGPDCFTGQELVCVADQSFLTEQALAVGDTLTLELFRYVYDLNYRGFHTLGVWDLQIVGATDMAAVQGAPNAVMPLNAARLLHGEAGEDFYASSASFIVRDPMRLNECKEAMPAAYLAHADFSGNSYRAVAANVGTALLMDDANFILSATRLMESLDLLNAFLPVIIAVLAVIGYFVAYLMVQSRANEYAVLRLLGLGKGRSVGMYFLEMTVLTLAGALVGLLLALIFGIVSSMGSALGIFVLFVACFLLGSLIALWRLSRVNVMLALSRAD